MVCALNTIMLATDAHCGHQRRHPGADVVAFRLSTAAPDADRGQSNLTSSADQQITEFIVSQSGMTAKRKAPLDETDSKSIHRSKRARTSREDVHEAEAEAVEGLRFALQMLAEVEVAQSNTDKFNNGHDEDHFHMVHPSVEAIPAFAAGPNHQPTMPGLDTEDDPEREKSPSEEGERACGRQGSR